MKRLLILCIIIAIATPLILEIGKYFHVYIDLDDIFGAIRMALGKAALLVGIPVIIYGLLFRSDLNYFYQGSLVGLLGALLTTLSPISIIAIVALVALAEHRGSTALFQFKASRPNMRNTAEQGAVANP